MDFVWLKKINQTDHTKWDQTMKITSNSVFIVTPVSVGGILYKGYSDDDKEMIRNGYKSILTVGMSALLTSGLKYVVNRPRPYVRYPNDIVPRCSTGPFSFPSGHTSLAFATATAITLSTRNIYLAIPSYLYAGFVGYSRMRLGVHFPSDVLGGMIIGIGSGLLTWQLDQMINK